MVSNIKWLLAGVTLLTACQTERNKEDSDLLQKVLTGYFEGIEQKDTVRLKALTTEDFVLFEDGAAWNNDSAFKNIRKHLPFTVKYRLGDIRVHSDDHSGDIVYTNHADFVFQDSIKETLDWLESATFRKTASGWKMNFLHLTVRDPRYDTIRYFREHYEARVKLFSSEPLKTRGILFLGNSITEYGDWKQLTGDSTAVNRGIARQPGKLFVEIGINDISQGIPAAVIEENIFTIVARVRKGSPATSVYVMSVLPTNDDVRQEYPELYGKNGVVDLLDYDLRRNATGQHYVYIDLQHQLSDGNGDLDRKFSRPDGLHLNAEGYRLWINLLRVNKWL